MNYFNEYGGADVCSSKADPHMEYVWGNYWLSTVSYSLLATCVQCGRTATTMQDKGKQEQKCTGFDLLLFSVYVHLKLLESAMAEQTIHYCIMYIL